MVRSFFKFTGLALLTIFMTNVIAFAQETGGTAATEPGTPADASFKSRCDNVPEGYPPCATSPAECASGIVDYKWASGQIITSPPFNCVFLQEPIGGKPGYDLYKYTCVTSEKLSTDGSVATETCSYVLWYGEALVGSETGPFQAVLAYEPGKESQGPFGLLYNYLGLVYNFLSGIIIAFVVLIAIIGGIRMTTSAGNQEAFGAGRSMIIKALIGMALWFTASVILYTINPTFFAF